MADEQVQAAIEATQKAAGTTSAATASAWDRLTAWASEHKTVVYTIAGVTLVATGAGIIYYVSGSGSQARLDEVARGEKKSKKERRKAKKEAQEALSGSRESSVEAPAQRMRCSTRKVVFQLTREHRPKGRVLFAQADRGGRGRPACLERCDTRVALGTGKCRADHKTSSRSDQFQERKDYAAKLKAAGNKAYGSKNYNEAIALYSKALLCKPDPVFYSNRAACHNAMSDWDNVIADTTAALALDNEYVKALNRRANAYEQSEKNSEALLDYTASCIIDGFKNDQSAQSVERLLKKVAEAKAKAILSRKNKKLPSSMFVTNYLQSFRTRPVPAGLEDSAELPADSGKGQMRKGLHAMTQRSAEGYAEASASFDKALELGDLGAHEAYALNLRGTFRYLKGDSVEALEDLTKSIELQPSLTQSYIKRASMHLEQGNKDAAAADFEKATEQNKDDPDIYYHWAQLHFILGEFSEAAKDYQKSIEIDKDFIFSHIQLGVTQYKMGSIASSMATFRRCRKNFPQVPDVFNYYGELLLDQQKYQEAVEQFDQAVEIEKSTKTTGMNVLPLINKALAVFQWRQDFSTAEELCQKALSSRSRNVRYSIKMY